MTLKADVDALVSKFTKDLEALVRSAAVEAVQSVLGSTLGGNSRARALPAARAKPGPKPRAINVEKASAPRPAAKAGKRLRRSADDIAKLGQSIADYVKANPGSSAEKIKAGLKIPGPHWMLSIGWALDNKKVTRKGIKRSAQYSPAGAAAIAKPAPVPPIKRAK